MKYLTRKIRGSRERWEKACQKYREHLATILPELPISMQRFSEITFHDARIEGVLSPEAGHLIITVDATRNPWGPVGWYQIDFFGVRGQGGLYEAIGEEWLYAEVHLHEVAGFEYHVDTTGFEFWIAADDVRWHQGEPEEAKT